jgi:hypothetical protein
MSNLSIRRSLTLRLDGPQPCDWTDLRRFVGGVVLYDGETCASFGDRMYAVALRMLWETP